jgi:hypothetical protein
MTKPKPKPKPKRLSKTLTATQVADLLGITLEAVMMSRARGLPPGTLAYHNKANVLTWDRADLEEN